VVLYILQNKVITTNNYLVISDSLNSITGIQIITHPSGISNLIQDKTQEARDMGIDICFLWVPATRTLWSVAYSTTKKQLRSVKSSLIKDTIFHNIYTYKYKKKYQTNINHKWLKLLINKNTKLTQIKNHIDTWHITGLKKNEETILNRLRIGHTFITHKHFVEIKTYPYKKRVYSQIHNHRMPKI